MSAVVCAVCAKPIAKPQKWKISGTEVFHEACVVAYGTAGSLSHRQQRQIADLRADIERLRYEVESEKHKAAHERANAKRIADERDRQGNELGQALVDVRAYRLRMEEARRDRDEATAQRDAARREAQLHQTIQGAPAAPAPISTPEVAKDERDATEVRYSLMELD